MKRVVLFFVMCVTAMAASAQSDDFGLWTSLEIQKKIDKKWSVGLEAEMRTRDDVKTVDRWSGGLDVSYKILKGLKVSAGYTFLWDNNERISYYEEGDKKVINGAVNAGDPKKRAQYWGPRHRFSVSLTGEKSFGPWGFSLRERWQYTYRPEHVVPERWSYYDEDWDGDEHTYRGKGKNVLRSRLQVEYKKKGQKVVPFASAEFYNAWSLEKTRYSVGAEWRITKQHSLDLCYRYQDVRDNDFDFEPDTHILSVGYQFKF